jgi:hypothetical protein
MFDAVEMKRNFVMEDAFISYDEIKKELRKIEELGITLTQRLSLLEQNIVYIFSQIKLCKNMEIAQKYFEILDSIQITLSILVHRESINISDRLWRFMSDFDNFEEVKNDYFEKIKNGEYRF